MTSKDRLPEVMQAWRVHQWGVDPLEALVREEVPLPAFEAGEVLVRVEVIPLNLNDLERVNGRNMMVRPELPVTPGMEVLGKCAPRAPRVSLGPAHPSKRPRTDWL